jgi:pimeloyl-ACP methyl ester carboxylesterase
MKRRHLLASAVLTAPAVMAATPPPAGAKHTFVLQHGAWHGGWCWAPVAELLRSKGHIVFTPTATGLGDRSHLISKNVDIEMFVNDLVSTIKSEELQNIVLVGHSFGGIAISGAADRVPERIRKLVFLEAAILQPGQSVLDGVPPAVAAQRRQAISAGGGVSLPAPPPSYFGVSDGPAADWLRRQLTPHPAVTYDSPLMLKNPVGNGLPTTYISCTRMPLASIEPMRQWARAQPSWSHRELDAVHDAMVTAPAALADMLLQIAAS